LAACVDSIHHDGTGQIQYHYTIIDFAALWQSGEPRHGGDAVAARWASESEFEALNLWPEARRAVAAAGVVLRV
jgi:hypothetical protein